MSAYTEQLRARIRSISMDDENFIEELLEIAQLFRPFSEALDEFLIERGFDGDISDIEARVAFIRDAFVQADMTPPREIREWYTAGQPIRRDTAFQICFAFGLDGSETDEFFRRIYAHERSLDCHRLSEAVYYFCLNNDLTWQDAEDIIRRLPEPPREAPADTAIHTGQIMSALNYVRTPDELVAYLTGSIAQFSVGNVTAYEIIHRLWGDIAGPDGLLVREGDRLYAATDDLATGRYHRLRVGEGGVRPWDAYLAILQLDKRQVSRLDTDRSIRPILQRLHEGVRDSFPDRQGIDLILRGQKVSYERVRKWLILLTYYAFWARRALANGHYRASPGDAGRCLASMNQYLVQAGYPELYIGNPYDWIFFYTAESDEPLIIFREIWNSLLGMALE